jgi:protocatechuate 3,4-dioxygenase beta subunit
VPKTLAVIILALLAASQSAPARTGSAIITGQVVDDDMNRPIDGARVTRWLASANDASHQFEVITDAQGRFAFRNITLTDTPTVLTGSIVDVLGRPAPST